MADDFPYRLNITERDYAALGRLIVYCAHIEFLLLRRAVKGLEPEAAARQSKLPVADNVRRLGESLEAVENLEARGKLVAAHQVLEYLFERRNALVHGAWMIDPADGRSIAVNPRQDRTPCYGEEATAVILVGAKATNDLLTGMMLENGVSDFPLPMPFLYRSSE